MPLDALLGQNQLLEPGILRHAQPLDVALTLHQLQNVRHRGAGDGKLPLDVPLEHRLVPVAVEILDDPPVHGGGLLYPVGAGKLVQPAEDQVIHPAQLGGNDLRPIPRRVQLAGLFNRVLCTHNGFPLFRSNRSM